MRPVHACTEPSPRTSKPERGAGPSHLGPHRHLLRRREAAEAHVDLGGAVIVFAATRVSVSSSSSASSSESARCFSHARPGAHDHLPAH